MTLAKVALAILTIVLAGSVGGGFVLLALLAPLHVWAARRSGPVGRVVWSFGPVVAALMCSWTLVYVTVGEAKPAIWLVPTLAAVTVAVFMPWAARRTTSRP